MCETKIEPTFYSEEEWQATIRYAKEHESELVTISAPLPPPPKADLAQHIFDTLLASNRLMAEQLRRAP